MTGLTLATVLQAALLSTGAQTYAEAHKQNEETGKPLIVMVGADWCPACQRMKNDSLPVVERRGLLRRVAFAIVNSDREHDLATKLMTGNSLPQLIVYRKTASGWQRKAMTGSKSPAELEKLINEVADDTSEADDTAVR